MMRKNLKSHLNKEIFMVKLAQHQIDALKKMHNGCILRGDVGSGKSRTALAYYYISVCKGKLIINGKGSLGEMKAPRDLFIITTAKKRDDESWFDESAEFGILPCQDENPSHISITVDSWNNIKKYTKVYGAFFIFDEQRIVGSGEWVKAFYKIAQKNQWILLTATPGDTWTDYIPVFVANGFYKNKTAFRNKHIDFDPHCTKYPKIIGYHDTGVLMRYRNQILVNMKDQRSTDEHHIEITCNYNKDLYKSVKKDRWNFYDNEPIAETGKLCYLERRVANEDPSRIVKLTELLQKHNRVIIFYNFDYELEILRELMNNMKIPFTEWNGHIHKQLPTGDRWCYLVQYAAGCEAWNCTTSNVIIFYSQNYSYKVMKQSAGRINRMNTPYKDLYYYHLRSYAPIDIAIKRALALKKNFNEKAYVSK